MHSGVAIKKVVVDTFRLQFGARPLLKNARIIVIIAPNPKPRFEYNLSPLFLGHEPPDVRKILHLIDQTGMIFLIPIGTIE